jgi:hypothetical protein
MDQDFLLRDVLEQTCEVSPRFEEWIKLASRVSAGRRHYDREYLLPDFTHTFCGEVKLPRALLLAKDSEHGRSDAVEVDDEEDSDVDEAEMNLCDHDDEDDGSNAKKMEDGDDGSVDDEDEEDESLEQARRRLLAQREEEERRRREEEAERQVLHLSVERFAIPEVLFRPSDAGLPPEWAGLPAAVVQSIQACPLPFQPALYQSIHLVGGLSRMPGLKERLEREIRSLAPCEFPVSVSACPDPTSQVWRAANRFAAQHPVENWSMSREDVAEATTSSSSAGKRGVWKRMGADGGLLV